jgi:hypothetical protein
LQKKGAQSAKYAKDEDENRIETKADKESERKCSFLLAIKFLNLRSMDFFLFDLDCDYLRDV